MSDRWIGLIDSFAFNPFFFGFSGENFVADYGVSVVDRAVVVAVDPIVVVIVPIQISPTKSDSS